MNPNRKKPPNVTCIYQCIEQAQTRYTWASKYHNMATKLHAGQYARSDELLTHIDPSMRKSVSPRHQLLTRGEKELSPKCCPCGVV